MENLEEENKKLKEEIKSRNKLKKIKAWISIFFLTIILVLLIFALVNKPEKLSIEEIKCISENSVLYTQLGCHACEKQLDILDLELFKIIDCWYEVDLCNEKKIMSIPTWEINGEFYAGKKSLKELKELTGC